MSSSTTFTGALLRLQSVTPLNQGATIRVRFTQDPQQSNPAGANDGLNIANYGLVGPTGLTITGSSTVSGDPQSIYLTLSAPLAAGVWTLTAANIKTVSGANLQPPFSIQFTVTSVGASPGINEGSTNDDAEQIIRKHLSPGIKQYENAWSSLIVALSTGDTTNFANSALAFDQLYKSTASGIYLDRRSADDGIIRPDSVGIGDDIFRRLSIKTTTKKVVTQALLEILEVYYGTDSTRAHLTTDIGEPYNIQDGWTLTLKIDGDEEIVVPFVTGDFAQIGNAKAREVAAVITRWLKTNGSTAYALEFIDPDTGARKPIIYSGALGLESSVQVTGGRVQNVLHFPTFLTQAQAANTWAVTKPSPGRSRYKIINATTTDLNQVFVGDYVNIFGNNFAAVNQGTFEIVAVDVRYVAGVLEQYFEVKNDFASIQATVTIVGPDDLVFFRPTKTTINDNGNRAVVVAQTSPREVDVQFPATTVAVTRGPRTAAYLQNPEALTPTSLSRHVDGIVTIQTSANHGLSIGSQVLLSGIVPSSAPPATVAGNGTTTTDSSLVTIWSTLGAPAGNAVNFPESVTLLDGRVLVAGGQTVAPAAAADTRIFAISASTVLTGGEVRYTYSWTARTAIPVARFSHRMTLLADTLQAGNVLLTGGWNGVAAPMNTAYLYDVVANTWTATPAMVTARQDHSQLTLADSRIMVAGGRSAFASTQTAAVELFTPTGATGVFNSTGVMTRARYKFGLVQLNNGKVLAAGGFTAANNTVATAKCELWDPMTGTWTAAASMAYARGGFAMVALGGNQFMVLGGKGKISTDPTSVVDANLRTTEIYDGNTNRWHPGPSFSITRNDVRAVVADSHVVLTGSSATAERFDILTRTWLPVRTNPSHGFNSTMARASFNGVDFVVVYGGSNNGGATPLTDAVLLVRASDYISDGGLMDAPLRVASVVSPTIFTVSTPEHLSYTLNSATDAVVTPFRAQAATTIPGPYVLNPHDGPAVTGVVSVLTEAIAADSQYAVLKITAATAALFPDEEGWLVLGFGTSNELTPVKYLGRASPDQLLLDFGQAFPKDLAIGTTVTLLLQKGPFNPANPQNLGVFYLTDSSSGRVAASQSIDAVVAAGIIVDKTIVYPGDRGLGGEGLPTEGVNKLSDATTVWAGNDIDDEVDAAREGI